MLQFIVSKTYHDTTVAPLATAAWSNGLWIYGLARQICTYISVFRGGARVQHQPDPGDEGREPPAGEAAGQAAPLHGARHQAAQPPQQHLHQVLCTDDVNISDQPNIIIGPS